MNNLSAKLQVLLVEDHQEDLSQYLRDFPSVFSSCHVEADIHPCLNFDDAFEWISNPLYQYDLIIWFSIYRYWFLHRTVIIVSQN